MKKAVLEMNPLYLRKLLKNMVQEEEHEED